jgi:hypothetical protein
MKLNLVRQQKLFHLSKSLVLRIVSSKDFQAQWPAPDSPGAQGLRLGYVLGLAVVVDEPWDAGDSLEPAGTLLKARQRAPQKKPEPDPTHIVILTARNGDLTKAVWADEIYFPEEELL